MSQSCRPLVRYYRGTVVGVWLQYAPIHTKCDVDTWPGGILLRFPQLSTYIAVFCMLGGGVFRPLLGRENVVPKVGLCHTTLKLAWNGLSNAIDFRVFLTERLNFRLSHGPLGSGPRPGTPA